MNEDCMALISLKRDLVAFLDLPFLPMGGQCARNGAALAVQSIVFSLLIR